MPKQFTQDVERAREQREKANQIIVLFKAMKNRRGERKEEFHADVQANIALLRRIVTNMDDVIEAYWL
jgi:hypothetical protein